MLNDHQSKSVLEVMFQKILCLLVYGVLKFILRTAGTDTPFFRIRNIAFCVVALEAKIKFIYLFRKRTKFERSGTGTRVSWKPTDRSNH